MVAYQPLLAGDVAQGMGCRSGEEIDRTEYSGIANKLDLGAVVHEVAFLPSGDTGPRLDVAFGRLIATDSQHEIKWMEESLLELTPWSSPVKSPGLVRGAKSDP